MGTANKDGLSMSEIEDEKYDPGTLVVEVPATTANLGPGFDTLGLALDLANRFTCRLVSRRESDYIYLESLPFPVRWRVPEELNKIIEDPAGNLILKSLMQVLAERDGRLPPVEIGVELNVPLSRGLGSSATAIVGGMFIGREILRRVYDRRISLEELQFLGNYIEGHPDNITPAIFGGFCFGYGNELGDYLSRPFTSNLEMAIVIPEYTLPTEEARAGMPEKIPMEDAVANLRAVTHWQLFMESGDFDWLRRAVKDRLHQPYRTPLIPDFDAVQEMARANGEGVVTVSGAGPTILAMFPHRTDLRPFRRAVEEYAAGVDRALKVLAVKPDNIGARLLRPLEPQV